MCCLLIPTIWCVFACVFSIYSLDVIEEHLERLNVSEVFEKSVIFLMLGFLFITILSNWWIFAFKKNFEVIFDTLKEVDDELETLKVPVNFRRHKMLTFVLIATIKVLVSANVLVSYHIVTNYMRHFQLWCAALATMIIYMESSIFTFYHFMFFMWSVKVRYENVNLFIKRQFIDTKSVSERDGNENLHKASVLHDKLVDISECINRCYGVPVSCLNILNKKDLKSFF